MTEFGTLRPDGAYVHVRTLPQSAMLACPFCIIDASHYRDDTTCKCDDPAERQRMIAEWEYTESDFAGIPLRAPGGDQ